MIRSLFSALGAIFRFLLVLILIAVLLLVGFVAYKGSQSMQTAGANEMTYWQFMRERIDTIRALPAKCQQMHFTGYMIAVPVYPILYTFVGLFPDSFLARHTQLHPLIPQNLDWEEVPSTWWSLVEAVSWEAWATPHVPTVMPECNLKAPVVSSSEDDK